MGCDIHLNVEQRTDDGWQPVPTDFGGRRYVLFAALAGVRNGGKSFVPLAPISEPRGLPEDVTDQVRAESDDWGVDGHSHSWLTLRELLAHDWDATVHRSCWVRRIPGLTPRRSETADQFAERLQDAARSLRGLPDAQYWHYESCAWSSEGQGASGWRAITWPQALGDLVGTEWWRLLARLWRLASPDDIRIVFWFDN